MRSVIIGVGKPAGNRNRKQREARHTFRPLLNCIDDVGVFEILFEFIIEIIFEGAIFGLAPTGTRLVILS